VYEDPTELPTTLYRAGDVRALDRRAIDEHAIPGFTLMTRAGEVSYRLLCARFPRARKIAVVCGAGNNGGDGYVVARLAHEHGRQASVLQLGDVTKGKGDAALAREACVRAGTPIRSFSADALRDVDLVVDAVLGTGLEREVTGEYRAAIDAINESACPVLSVDIPSGLHADRGQVMGVAVNASATMTFIGLKAGLFTGEGRACSGAIYFDDLGVPGSVYEGIAPRARRIVLTDLIQALPERATTAHKGKFGRVLIIGGNGGMAGACTLAALAAYRAGAGHVTVATRAAHVAAVVCLCPEALVYGIDDATSLAPLMERADVIAVGPGLGRDEWAKALFGATLDAERPMVVDADGLNLLAADPCKRSDWVLTPHPAEAGRLLGMDTAQVQSDRFAAVDQLVARYGGVSVLKGSGTLVNDGSSCFLCDRGTPAMASAGMGDLLTGVMAALIGQGLAVAMAARAAVWLHAVAGEDAAQYGAVSVRASELLTPIAARLGMLASRGSA